MRKLLGVVAIFAVICGIVAFGNFSNGCKCNCGCATSGKCNTCGDKCPCPCGCGTTGQCNNCGTSGQVNNCAPSVRCSHCGAEDTNGQK
jgi:hypothetical protein